MDQTVVVIGLFLMVLLVIGGAISGFWILVKSQERREVKLLAALAQMANRVHAKDLSGYMALTEQANSNAGPSGIRDDAAEARIARMRGEVA